MRHLRLRKKMLTMVAFAYAGILAVSVTYAAVTGLIDVRGIVTTSADLQVELFTVTAGPQTVYFSNVSKIDIADDSMSVDITVDLKAPGDMVYVVFRFDNVGKLPAEFEDPEVNVFGVDDRDEDGNRIRVVGADGTPVEPPSYIQVHPVMIEGFSDAGDGISDFEDLDGYVLAAGARSDRFGMAFIWDEDTHFEAGCLPNSPGRLAVPERLGCNPELGGCVPGTNGALPLPHAPETGGCVTYRPAVDALEPQAGCPAGCTKHTEPITFNVKFPYIIAEIN